MKKAVLQRAVPLLKVVLACIMACLAALLLTACGASYPKNTGDIKIRIDDDFIEFSGSGRLATSEFDWGDMDLGKFKRTVITGEITSLGDLSGLDQLEEVVINAQLSEMEAYALADHYKLKSLNMADGGCVVIGNGALRGCYSLKTLCLPRDIMYMPPDTLVDCTALDKIYFINPEAVTLLDDCHTFSHGNVTWSYTLDEVRRKELNNSK